MVVLNSQKKALISDSLGFIYIYNLVHTPPLRIHEINTGSKNSLKTLKFNEITNTLYTCCYHDGRIYGYKVGDSSEDRPEVTSVFSMSGMRFCRELEIVPELGLLFVGYVGGYIYVFDLKNSKTPICKFFNSKTRRVSIKQTLPK